MATYNKITAFLGHIYVVGGDYNLNTDVIRVALARDTDPPTAADTVIGNITQPTGTGYAAGGEDTTNTFSIVAGTGTLQGTSIMWTASAANWQSFQYVFIHNDTVSDQLIAWWDYASPLTLGNGETFSSKFSGAAVGAAGNIFTWT